jgi:hypothetical protein
MTTLYPGALDSLANPTSTTTMNASGALAHAQQHTNVNDAVDAMQTELGLNPKGSDASVVARLNRASYSGHTHVQADVTGLVTALAGKAASSHTHVEADVTSLVTDLAAKAAVTSVTTPSPLGVAAIGVSTAAARADHIHLQPTLGTLGAAATAHTHVIADTTSLQATLDAKALAATTITAGSGLTGGGSLAANRTFDISWAGTGAAATAARSDHNHNAVYAKVVALSTGTTLPSVGSYSEGDMVVFY